MNKIININLAGRLIPIDEEAYETLTAYLAALKHFFEQEEGGSEILHDMEDRIGELFQDKIKKGAAAISNADVAAIIEIMGRPEQIVEEAGEETGNAADSEPGAAQQDPRRITRSSKEKVIGGVCGGIAVHFNIDPVVVRVIFALISLAWGTGVLVYLLLWILLPETNATAKGFKRRLYRNQDQKIIGGVCSGIAAYLNIDAIWVRLVFLLPFISGLSIGLFEDFILPFTFGGIPLLFLLYVILWIALPKANTVAEKLEMRGKKIDLRNLSDAIKNTAASPETRRRVNSFWVVLFKIFGFIVGGLVLLIVLALLVTLAVSFFQLGTSFNGFPWIQLVTDNPLHQKLLWIALILVLIIPIYALVRGAIYLLSGKSARAPGWLRITTVVLFVGSIFTLFWIIGAIASDFKVRYHKTNEVVLNPIQSDTIIVTEAAPVAANIYGSGEGIERIWQEDDFDCFRILNDSILSVNNIRLKIVKSPDSLFHLQVEQSAYGSNAAEAKQRALPLELDYHQVGNTIYLPAALRLSTHQPFRGQQLMAILSVPEGKVFYLRDVDDSHWQYERYGYDRGRIIFESSRRGNYEEGNYYRMESSGDGIRLNLRNAEEDDWE